MSQTICKFLAPELSSEKKRPRQRYRDSSLWCACVLNWVLPLLSLLPLPCHLDRVLLQFSHMFVMAAILQLFPYFLFTLLLLLLPLLHVVQGEGTEYYVLLLAYCSLFTVCNCEQLILGQCNLFPLNYSLIILFMG